MIFEIAAGKASRVQNNWQPGELELEGYLVCKSDQDTNARLFDADVFGESLLFIDNQVLTKQGKRADILALDEQGNGVFIELKKREAKQGVEMQALQYLANYSNLKGQRFLDHFKSSKDAIDAFLGEYEISRLNANSRIILVARAFDESVLSMGEWLASQGDAYRCIEYTPFRVGDSFFLSFSVRFDRSRESLYRLNPESDRTPQPFWHNIGASPLAADRNNLAGTDRWWRHQVEQGFLSAAFNEERGDAGDRTLNSYIAGDTVIGYASGYGAVGWAVVEAPAYDLVDLSYDPFTREGHHRHRLRGVKWKNIASSIADAISAKELKERFRLNHPIQTKSKIRRDSAEALLAYMKTRFRGIA